MDNYNNAILSKNCSSALKYFDKILQVEPVSAYQILGMQYQNGICRKQSNQKAIEAYQAIPFDKLDSLYAIQLKHLLFLQSETVEQQKESLEGIREIFYDFLLMVNSGQELEKLITQQFKNHPAFLKVLKNELFFLKKNR